MLLNCKPGLWGSVAVAWVRRNWRPSRCSAPDVSIANTSSRTALLLKSNVRQFLHTHATATDPHNPGLQFSNILKTLSVAVQTACAKCV